MFFMRILFSALEKAKTSRDRSRVLRLVSSGIVDK